MPATTPAHQKHFRIPISALLATSLSLAGYGLCSWYEKSQPWLVGLGLVLALGGFIGVALALILDSDHEDDVFAQHSPQDRPAAPNSSLRE